MTTVDLQLYNHLNKITKKKFLIKDLNYLSKGILGKIYTAELRPPFENTKLVLKEISKNSDYVDNEIKALKYLATRMISGDIPYNYIFLYGTFMEDKYKYLMLEKASITLSNLAYDYDISLKEYVKLYYNIGQAVKWLERIEMNHGDLWDHNVMIKWDSKPSEFENVNYTVKLIDFDSAYKAGVATKPSLGGSDLHRRKFIIGYDINRLVDAVLAKYCPDTNYDYMPIEFKNFLDTLQCMEPTDMIRTPRPDLAAENFCCTLRVTFKEFFDT